MSQPEVSRKTLGATLSFLNQRHTLLIINALAHSPQNFTQLHQSLAVNTATLSKRIKELQDKLLIIPLSCTKDSRICYYTLTDKGQKVSLVLKNLPAI